MHAPPAAPQLVVLLEGGQAGGFEGLLPGGRQDAVRETAVRVRQCIERQGLEGVREDAPEVLEQLEVVGLPHAAFACNSIDAHT